MLNPSQKRTALCTLAGEAFAVIKKCMIGGNAIPTFHDLVMMPVGSMQAFAR